MMSNLYRIEDEQGRAIAPFLIECEVPFPGQEVRILNYPRVDQYLISAMRPTPGWRDMDPVNRLTIVLAPNPAPASARKLDNILVFTPSVQIVQRLNRALHIAQEEIDEKLSLHISRKDFAALCLSIGIFESEFESFAGLAYRDVPMTLGDARTGWTMFEGFKIGMAYVRVTSMSGEPFEVDDVYTSAILKFAANPSRAEDVRTEILKHMDAGADPDVPRFVRDMLIMVRDGEMSVFLAAQALTEIASKLRELQGQLIVA
ncbi:hypothetical protein [Asticcacaulis sp. W401b]|uniref:hypothetical protein n=1 Tax=Asticcacaulis sp. W401b TaxID=3388666 RepID=UPI00397115BF